jgi:hypothetical protein
MKKSIVVMLAALLPAGGNVQTVQAQAADRGEIIERRIPNSSFVDPDAPRYRREGDRIVELVPNSNFKKTDGREWKITPEGEIVEVIPNSDFEESGAPRYNIRPDNRKGVE